MSVILIATLPLILEKYDVPHSFILKFSYSKNDTHKVYYYYLAFVYEKSTFSKIYQ